MSRAILVIQQLLWAAGVICSTYSALRYYQARHQFEALRRKLLDSGDKLEASWAEHGKQQKLLLRDCDELRALAEKGVCPVCKGRL